MNDTGDSTTSGGPPPSMEPATENNSSASEATNVQNLYKRPKIDIDQCLLSDTIPDKDKERLRDLQTELASDTISKNRRKKLWKEIEWVANRKRRNDEKKAERKKRQLEIREGIREPSQKRQRIVRMSESACKIRVALDLTVHNLMTDAERMKAGKQTQRCYSMNRRTDKPLQLYLTGLEGTEYWTGKMPGFENWDIHRIKSGHVEHFGKDQVVYLSGDSENELSELVESEVYIIGCMVDHNRLKGVTHQRALDAGVRHARLPLDRYVDMKTRKVLTIDHCFEILLNRVNGMTWKEAIIKAIPARKGAQLKDFDDPEDDAKDSDEDEGIRGESAEEQSQEIQGDCPISSGSIVREQVNGSNVTLITDDAGVKETV